MEADSETDNSHTEKRNSATGGDTGTAVCSYCLHMSLLVEHSPRTRSVVGSNPTQGSFFFEKRESCPGCKLLFALLC